MESAIVIFHSMSVSFKVPISNDIETLSQARVELEADLLEEFNKTSECEWEKVLVKIYEIKVKENDDSIRKEKVRIEAVTDDVHEVSVKGLTEYSENKVISWTHSFSIKIFPKYNCKSQDDGELIDMVKKKILISPKGQELNHQLIKSQDSFSENRQDEFVDQIIFKGQVKNGFFVEAGATDFVVISNSLHFEIHHGWSGLLVEAHPLYVKYGLQVNRNVWAVPYCLALKTTPHFANFSSQPFLGGMYGIVPQDASPEQLVKDSDTFKTQCFPFFTMLQAIDNPRVNLFILDIEGAEFEVLKTIPWKAVDIEVLIVELEHSGKVFPGTRNEVIRFLEVNDYNLIGNMHKDDIFIRKDLIGTKYEVDYAEAEKLFPEFKKFKPENEKCKP